MHRNATEDNVYEIYDLKRYFTLVSIYPVYLLYYLSQLLYQPYE